MENPTEQHLRNIFRTKGLTQPLRIDCGDLLSGIKSDLYFMSMPRDSGQTNVEKRFAYIAAARGKNIAANIDIDKRARDIALMKK